MTSITLKDNTPTEMSRRILARFVDAFAGLQVRRSYNIAYFAGGHAYHFTTTMGSLQVQGASSFEGQDRMLHESACQVHLPRTELGMHNLAARSTFGDMHWMTARSGKIFVSGDGTHFDDLQAELATAATPIDVLIAAVNSLDAPEGETDKTLIVASDGKKYSPKAFDAKRGQQALQEASQSMYSLDPQTEKSLKEYYQGFVKLSVNNGIYFSAVSTLQGNFAQANYCAANCFLDNLSCWQRMAYTPNFKSTAMQWGMVGGIGMRLKAFGSNDVIAQSAAALVMSLEEAKLCLRAMITSDNTPQWMCSTFMGGQSRSPVQAPALPSVEAERSSKVLEYGNPGAADEGMLLGYQGQTTPWGTEASEKLVHKLKPKQVEAPPDAMTKPKQDYYIAGSFDDWMTHDMSWDEQISCYTYQVQVDGNGLQFQICKGKSRGARLMSRGLQNYQIKKGESGHFEIRLALRENGSPKKVTWERLSGTAAAAATKKAALNTQEAAREAETTDAGTDSSSDSGSDSSGTAAPPAAAKPSSMLLKKLLQAACPSWSDECISEGLAKLLAANIATVPNLLASLHENGAGSLDSRLKVAGQKPFSQHTIDALRTQADALAELAAAAASPL
eukprot:gnl/TRDRNA2_/TRDRNA2_183039_c0_seq1.p1 gnl/TRDRNA2_/TRDRNA2_183039_c0~~gnl/TRDRNA2_/TRDRNA2_183039_c0_seq1.p1  ORF type:complete len:617 (+),score=136.26 gnl/TRDRNA2_/TRDRNA2_183039_c0_seq1:73-1923(+)